MNHLEIKVEDKHAGERLDRFVARALAKDASRMVIQKWIRAGEVRVNQAPVAKPSYALEAGDMVAIDWMASPKRKIKAQSIPLDIVYEDDALLVVNKPVGMVVHPAPGNRTNTLVNALLGSEKPLSESDNPDRPGIVHRIDKDTSGLVVIAKDNRAHRRMTEMFQERLIKKMYRAIVSGQVAFDAGEIKVPIGRHPRMRLLMSVRYDEAGKEALTEYRVLERCRYATSLEVRIHTGRTHQIRVHFAHLGYPVLGDTVYGPNQSAYARPALHAHELEFEHPLTGKALHLVAPLPDDFKQILAREKERT